MADNYLSVTSDYELYSKEVDHAGTSSTAGDKVELRFDTALTTAQVLGAIRRIERYIMERKVVTYLPVKGA